MSGPNWNSRSHRWIISNIITIYLYGPIFFSLAGFVHVPKEES
jgi:hypothetical protein